MLPFASASLLDGIKSNYKSMAGTLAVIAILGFILFKRRKNGMRQEEQYLGKVMGMARNGWNTDRKKKHENNTLALLNHQEREIEQHQEDVVKRLDDVRGSLGSYEKYEEKVVRWAKELRNKTRNCRKTVVRNLRIWTKNDRRSDGIRAYIPWARNKGYVDSNLIFSQLTKYFRTVSRFLLNNLSGFRNYNQFLDRMQGKIDMIKNNMGEIAELGRGVIAFEKKEGNVIKLIRADDARQVSRARQLRGWIKRGLRRAKSSERIARHEEGIIKSEVRVESEIERMIKKVRDLIVDLQVRIEGQRYAIKEILGECNVLEQNIYEFKYHAKRIESCLGKFNGKIYKDILQLEEVIEHIKILDSRMRRKELDQKQGMAALEAA